MTAGCVYSVRDNGHDGRRRTTAQHAGSENERKVRVKRRPATKLPTGSVVTDKNGCERGGVVRSTMCEIVWSRCDGDFRPVTRTRGQVVAAMRAKLTARSWLNARKKNRTDPSTRLGIGHLFPTNATISHCDYKFRDVQKFNT